MSDKYEASGVIYQVGPVVQVNDKFRKREFVVRTGADTKYPQLVPFEVANDKCADLDGLMLGDEVRVSFDMTGREWQKDGKTKFFLTLKAWKVDVTGKAKHAPARPMADGGEIPF